MNESRPGADQEKESCAPAGPSPARSVVIAMAGEVWQGWNVRLGRVSVLMWRTAIVFLLLFVLCAALGLLDPRLFQGVSVWAKPAKFFLSLAVHLLTVTAALLLVPQLISRGPAVRAAAAVIVAMSVFEVLYIGIRAARGEASHFNTASELAALFYTAMGIAAVLIMLATATIGVIVLRHGQATLLGRTTGASFIIAAAATIWTGLAIGSMESHWIGGDQTDATGLPFLGWSTTGGDLRPAHFLGLHVMQILPAVALAGSRGLVLAAGLACAAGFVLAAGLAFRGQPLLASG
jgi:hypothetical protein